MEQAVPLSDQDKRLLRAKDSLEGLSVGDAFGQQFLLCPPGIKASRLEERILPRPSWPYTDDTQMALSLVSILRQYGSVEQDVLAESFAERYDSARGYGPAMHALLRSLRTGRPWQEVARKQFGGQGSYGNGAAMRVAPLGAFFAETMEVVVEQAARSAEVTHTHPEAIAGAIAVGVAAAWAWRLRDFTRVPTRADFLDGVIPWVPPGEVREKLCWARDASAGTSLDEAVALLGNGSHVSAQDTVPFALWCAGEHLDDYEQALWLTANGYGDVDTTCAIVGGIVALSCREEGIPPAWRQAREPLPNWPFVDAYLP